MNHSVARVVILILILVLWIYQTHFLILLLFNIDAKKTLLPCGLRSSRLFDGRRIIVGFIIIIKKVIMSQHVLILHMHTIKLISKYVKCMYAFIDKCMYIIPCIYYNATRLNIIEIESEIALSQHIHPVSTCKLKVYATGKV